MNIYDAQTPSPREKWRSISFADSGLNAPGNLRRVQDASSARNADRFCVSDAAGVHHHGLTSTLTASPLFNCILKASSTCASGKRCVTVASTSTRFSTSRQKASLQSSSV